LDRLDRADHLDIHPFLSEADVEGTIRVVRCVVRVLGEGGSAKAGVAAGAGLAGGFQRGPG